MGGIKNNEFIDTVAAALDIERMYKDALAFSKLHRYSGSADGEKAVDIILQRMSQFGVSAERIEYEFYRSLPVFSELTINFGGEKRTYKATPFVYSGECENLSAKIVFDKGYVPGTKSHRLLQAERCNNFKGNIVFTYDSSFDFILMAKKYGAVAIVTSWPLDIAHHGTAGRVWGIPEPFDLDYKYPEIPYTELLKSNADELLELLDIGDVSGILTVKMDNGIKKSSMAIADIKGASDKYVLISGHYDSWYEGMTDNGVANVAMVDIARVFKENEGQLYRGVKLAWWSGHSDGRYSGSTWYYDNYFEDLKKNCVAHINMDICGCKGSDLVGFNSSTLEGKDFTREFLFAYNEGEPPAADRMIRFADQTFWGANIPFAIMPKFSVKDIETQPFYWWHTPEDGIDKVDKSIMQRDAEVIIKLAAYFAQIYPLPAHFDEFICLMENRLKEIAGNLSEAFDLSRIYPKLDILKDVTNRLMCKLPKIQDSDDIILKAAGELARISFTYGSPYQQDEAVERGLFPVLSSAMGINDKNTDPLYLLAYKNAFLRQVNRVCSQLDNVIQTIESVL